jgi:hypothetical protein
MKFILTGIALVLMFASRVAFNNTDSPHCFTCGGVGFQTNNGQVKTPGTP